MYVYLFRSSECNVSIAYLLMNIDVDNGESFGLRKVI